MKWAVWIFCICSVLMLLINITAFAAPAEQKKEKLLREFSEKLAKKHNMKFLNIGVGTIVGDTGMKKTAWDFSVMSNQKWTVDQARPIVVSMVREFWEFVSQNPVFAQKMQELGARYKWYDTTFGPERMGFKLAFWDENVDRPLPPYLAQVKVLEGRIEYYQADPKDQSLQNPPFTETFEQAFAVSRIIEKR